MGTRGKGPSKEEAPDAGGMTEIRSRRRHAFILLWLIIFLISFKALENGRIDPVSDWMLWAPLYVLLLASFVVTYRLVDRLPTRCPACGCWMKVIGNDGRYYILRCRNGHHAKMKEFRFTGGQHLPIPV